jgi:hypothetical protein
MTEYTVGQVLTDDVMPDMSTKRVDIFKEDYKNLLDMAPNKWVAMDVIDIESLDKAECNAKITKYYARVNSWNKKYEGEYAFRTYKDSKQFVTFGKRVINGI